MRLSRRASASGGGRAPVGAHGADEVLADVVDLLAACAAFTEVPRPELEQLAREAEVGYAAAPTDPVTAAFVPLRGGVVVHDAAGEPVDAVAEGELGLPAPGSVLHPAGSALVVWLPDRARGLAWRVPPEHLAVRLGHAGTRAAGEPLTAAVRTAMRAPVVTAEAGETCRVVAARMAEHRVSSVLVLGRGAPGIATDRDLRTRLVAAGRPPSTPVGEVATWPARTVPAGASLLEALVEMLATATHHLPVVEDGRVVGVLSSGDLVRLGTRSPLALRVAVDRAASVEEVVTALVDLPAVVEGLLDAGSPPPAVGRVVAAVTDRVQRRTLDLVLAARGGAPSSYAWVCFGSQARQEQSLGTDQDHALVLPDDVDPAARAAWADVAGDVVAALERCGYARCGGGVMASEEPWRRTATAWQDWYDDLVAHPTPDHVLRSAIALDVRRVAGDLPQEAWDRVLARARGGAAGRPVFLAQLARGAVAHRPPLGLLGRVAVERSGAHAGSVSVKAGVLLPLTDVARVLALARGGSEVATPDRLAAAVADGALSPDLGATLTAGHAHALGLRLRHHADQRRRGEVLDDHLRPADLDGLARAQLRETFRAVRTVQDVLAGRYRTGLLG